jgi:metal-dependent amidase/aminoacylase/carboxypeptidase family protein
MLDDGFLDLFPCEAMFGMHNMPGRPAGVFAAVSGPALASSDTCIIKVRGKGGHGAMPHARHRPGGGRQQPSSWRCRPSSRATCRRWTPASSP